MKRYFDFDMNDYKEKKCNFHSHTVRCQHATGEEREYVEQAISEGFEMLGFSDHSPYLFKNGYVSHIRMEMSELEGYVNTIEALKKEYRDDITIFLALEMEYFPGIFEPTIEEIRQYPMDYLLLAQHFFYENERFISVRQNWTDEMHLKTYVDLLTNALDTGYFNMVAHPDIVNFTGDEALYTKYMKKLADRLKEEQIPIEINVNGFRELCNYPDRRFVKIGAENGNEFIIGVDAHNPENFHDLASYQGCIKMAEDFGGRVFWK